VVLQDDPPSFGATSVLTARIAHPKPCHPVMIECKPMLTWCACRRVEDGGRLDIIGVSCRPCPMSRLGKRSGAEWGGKDRQDSALGTVRYFVIRRDFTMNSDELWDSFHYLTEQAM